MENEIEKKELNHFDKFKKTIKDNIKIFLSIIIIAIISSAGIFYVSYSKEIKNEKISEKYIKAGIYLSSKKKNKSKQIFEEIIFAKNKFYSPLALNSIIENNLEDDNQKVLNFFNVLEDIKMDRNDKDLIKLKKALYLKKNSKISEGNKLLNEIILEKSIWKDAALGLLEKN